ncbi:phosphotransferase [Pseudoneobacillus sp. C159]
MTLPWSPEIALIAEEARVLIEQQFPELNPVSITELGKGFDNTVFHVNGKFVFRFPRKEIAVELLKIENRLLPLLVKELPLKIPEPIFFGQPTEEYQWPFTGYHLVEGVSPGTLSFETRCLSAGSLALFLKKLHQFPVEVVKEIGVPHDRFERMNIPKRKLMLVDRIKKATDLGLLEDAAAVLAWLSSMNEIQLDTPVALVHGDCHVRNILVDEQGVISGVIDWGDTHIGHPAIDLSIAYSFLPANGREEFFQIYGDVSQEVKESAKFFAIYVATVLILYGNDVKDEKLVSSAQESIQLALS